MPIQDRHEEFEDACGQWRRVRDAIAGTDRIKDAGTDYLPRPSGMEEQYYLAYVGRARWYDVTERTLQGLTGAVFRREPQVEVPKAMEEKLNELSARGLAFNGMARAITREVLSVGRIGGLVDMPRGAQPTGTMPLVSLYDAEMVRDWNIDATAGRVKVTRVVLEEPLGQDEKSDKVQFRELMLDEAGLYVQNIWTKAEGTKEFKVTETITPTMGGKRLDFIPFVFFGVNDLDPDVEKPPLLGLTDENLGHYQLQADYRHALYLTSQPTPYVLGFSEKEQPTRIGSGDVWFSQNQDAKVGMLEFQGAGIEAQRQAILDSEVRMVMLGARFFETSKKAAEAAETIRLRFSADAATLTVVAQTVGEGLEQILQWVAQWSGQAEADITVRMNDDFVAIPMEPDQIRAYLQAWQAGAMAYSDLFALLQRGDLIAEGRTEEDVQSEIETTAPEIPSTGSQGAPGGQPPGGQPPGGTEPEPQPQDQAA